MEEPGDELLAGAALAPHQDADPRRGGPEDELLDAPHPRRLPDEEVVDAGRPLQRAVLLAEAVDVGLERAELPERVEGRRRERGDRLEEAPVPLVEGGAGPPAGFPVERDDDAEDPVPHDERRPGDGSRRGPQDRLVRPRERAARPAEVEDERVGRRGEGTREGGEADGGDDGGAAVLLEDDPEAPLGVQQRDGPRHDLVDERLLLAQDVERPGDVVEGLEAKDLLAKVERLAGAGVPDRHVSARRTPWRASGPRPSIRAITASAGAKRGLTARTGRSSSRASSGRPSVTRASARRTRRRNVPG